jgi:hypothetical protein
MIASRWKFNSRAMDLNSVTRPNGHRPSCSVLGGHRPGSGGRSEVHGLEASRKETRSDTKRFKVSSMWRRREGGQLP